MDQNRVLQFLNDCQERDEPCVLVTVCAVEGSSMRDPGAIMGVAENGEFSGSLSGGCIENAVVAEALEVLKAEKPRVVRYGAGSPYLDIKLPCGGGLDLHFCPLDDQNDLPKETLKATRARMPFSIAVSEGGASYREGWHPSPYDNAAGTGSFGHWPAPMLQIVGHGAGVEALAQLARTFGCWVKVFTPDQEIIDRLDQDKTWAYRLKRIDQTDVLTGDPWTATIFLFHDHDWEIDLMQRALSLPHFYIGAMGGRKAHAFRCEALAELGVDQNTLDTIHAPIGVFHSSRDPQTLALSTLAEVIRTYEESDFEVALG